MADFLLNPLEYDLKRVTDLFDEFGFITTPDHSYEICFRGVPEESIYQLKTSLKRFNILFHEGYIGETSTWILFIDSNSRLKFIDFTLSRLKDSSKKSLLMMASAIDH